MMELYLRSTVRLHGVQRHPLFVRDMVAFIFSNTEYTSSQEGLDGEDM
jgi:hypothetical protein